MVKNGFAPASASLDLAPGREQPVTIELTRMPSVEEHVTVSATRTDRGIEDQKFPKESRSEWNSGERGHGNQHGESKER